MIYPVILAGGVGSRLWPLSRSQFPKQCIDIQGNGKTMLQDTFERCLGLSNAAPATIVCNQDHRFLVAEQCKNYGNALGDILLEPQGKNTAAAIACAAWNIYKKDPRGVLLVLASDHVISDKKIFQSKVEIANARAELGLMVTFGIEPTYPETGYGYIKCEGNDLSSKIIQFVEKPELDVAKEYVSNGDYLWNSGMFMFRADALLEEFKQYSPKLLQLTERAVAESKVDLDFIRLEIDAFSSMESISIDYAVMEKTDNAEVVRMPNIWNDVGSWSAMHDIHEADSDGNIFKGDVIAKQTKNSFVMASNRLVSTLGIEDLIIIDTEDALLVANKNNAQDVKKIVDELVSRGRDEVNVHAEVFRPWGKYQTIDIGGRYQVKRISVNPQQRLSTQMHHHRAEHWVVVKGTAKVRNGDETLLITENESTYIPVGEIHSLENPGMVPLELIEVQTGSYLGEDDIVRFDDLYGRSK